MQDVAGLCLDHENDGIVSEPGVGPDQNEEVGEARYRDAEKRFGAVAQLMRQAVAAAAPDLYFGQRYVLPKTCRINERVEFVLAPVRGDEAATRRIADRFGNKRDVILVECLVVIVRNQDALAADLIIRPKQGAQPGIGDGFFEISKR